MPDEPASADAFGPSDAAREPDDLVLRHYLGILRRRLWIMLALFVIVVTLGTVWAFKITPTYQAVAKLLLERQAPRATTFEEVIQLPTSEEEYYKTQLELVTSRAVMERALEARAVASLPEVTGQESARPSLAARIIATAKTLLGVPPAKPRRPWERLREQLHVAQVRGTHLIEVKAQSVDPMRAALMANAVAGAFERHCLEGRTEISNEAFRFLQEQKDKQQKQVLKAEDALQEFREQAQVVSLDVTDSKNPILYVLTQLNEELTTVRLQRIERAASFAGVRKLLAADGTIKADSEPLFALPAVRGDALVTDLHTKLLAAEQNAASIASTYGPKHPQARTADAAVALLRSRFQTALQQLVRALETELETLTTQEQELERCYKEQNQLALDLARRSLAFARLEHEAERQRKLFDVLVERMREVDVNSGYAQANLQVVEAAEVPRSPYRPRKALLIFLAAVLGLALSVGAALLIEHVDDTIKTPEDMEARLGVPALGFVPSFHRNGSDEDGASEHSLAALLEPTSHVAEACRSIRTNLFYAAPSDDAKVIVITSASPGEGKTTVAANLAAVIARSGRRVLLIDADLRRRMLHTLFGLDPTRGLTNVLVGHASLHDAIQKPTCNGQAIEHLDVLTAGPKPPNPAELLDSTAMRQLLERARAEYDRVIIDTPPAVCIADASIVAGISDGAILIVRAAATPRPLALRARDQLLSVNARILGGILNDVEPNQLHYYDSYYAYPRYYDSNAASPHDGDGDEFDALEAQAAAMAADTPDAEPAASELTATHAE